MPSSQIGTYLYGPVLSDDINADTPNDVPTSSSLDQYHKSTCDIYQTLYFTQDGYCGKVTLVLFYVNMDTITLYYKARL